MMSWHTDATRILSAIHGASDAQNRVLQVSQLLMGTPYRARPLGGGPGRQEHPVYGLRRFDCVTFVESVVALTLAYSAAEYRKWILRVRYGERPPTWEHRLHYLSEWLECNHGLGIIQPVPVASEGVNLRKQLSLVPGIEPRTVEFNAHPWGLTPAVLSAHIAAFVSARPDLDVFHAGIVAGTMLRHASRSAGYVVEEPMEEFLARVSGRGLLLARIERGA